MLLWVQYRSLQVAGDPVAVKAPYRGYWEREQRNIYLAKLDASFHVSARELNQGRACDDIRVGCRKDYIGRHIIFYLEAAERVEISCILSDCRDVWARFDED